MSLPEAFIRADCESSDFNSTENDCGDAESDIKFTPPLFRQRYAKVFEILMTEDTTSVADFGCSECQALRILRNLASVELLCGVDIDRTVLENRIQGLQPLITDYVCPRPRPLKIQLFHGDILEVDPRFIGIDAVTMIEVIEHLNLEDLEKLPGVLFGQLHPKIVIFTTPNAEFNVLFPNLLGFRHPDHKFEWTRLQFSNWCDHVGRQYGYSVEYGGVGDPPEDKVCLGFCSQLAIFRRSESRTQPLATQSVECQPYRLVAEVLYPTFLKTTTLEEDLLYEAVYFINLLRRNSEDDTCEPDERGGRVVRLEELKSYSRLQHTVEDYVVKLREVMRDSGYCLSEDGEAVVFSNDDEEEEDDDGTCDAEGDGDSSTDQSNASADSDIPVVSAEEENWDL